MKGMEFNFNNLDEYILTALLKCNSIKILKIFKINLIHL